MSITKTYLKTKKAYKVTFSLPKTIEGEEIKVLGEFNNWDWQAASTLKPTSKGYSVALLLPPGKTYQFRYCIDDHIWMNDGSADGYAYISNYNIDNCVIDLPSYIDNPTKKKSTKKLDLTIIEGIGPKIASLLLASEYNTFNKIASAEPALLKEILVVAGKRYAIHDPSTWPEQAKLVADGKFQELKVLQAMLKGGKRT